MVVMVTSLCIDVLQTILTPNIMLFFKHLICYSIQIKLTAAIKSFSFDPYNL